MEALAPLATTGLRCLWRVTYSLPMFGKLRKQCFDRFWCDVDGTDHMRLTGSDDQRYRVTLAECSVDALQWIGAHVA